MAFHASWLRTLLIPAYFHATWPCRRLGAALAARLGKHPIAVVYYHRVADATPTPWTISNRGFVRQIDWLVRHVEIISLAEAQRRIAIGRNRRSAACITFDDGYADNCDQALPLLLERRIPFTYFVASEFVRSQRPFPHDAARGQLLRPNSIAELRSLADSGVEIGAHTRTHADLGRVMDRARLEAEIAGSRDDLEQMAGHPVRYFAFPYGQYQNLNALAFGVARDSGLAGVCSAYGGYNFPGHDAFHLQRLHADPHFPRFKNWLTFDPRMAAGVRRFHYCV
jgi:peptidoglycan/xylan/chitin deacetylase (PgdA/CDA1 family)